jgi:hypothetical protein
MPEVPPELRPLTEETTAMLSDELLAAWNRGVCDGLEVAAQMAESLLPHLVPCGDPTWEHEIVLGLVTAIRQSQIRVQVDATQDGGR